MSGLISIYLESVNSNILWRENSNINSSITKKPVLFKDKLTFKLENLLMTSEVCLTSSCLYFITEENLINMIIIKWCSIEGFTEEVDGVLKYGFTVSNTIEKQDFFTDSSKDLEMWIESLSYVGIMNDFDENYAIIKLIDSGQFGSVYLCEDLVTREQCAVKKILSPV
jgi:hypothetical protein